MFIFCIFHSYSAYFPAYFGIFYSLFLAYLSHLLSNYAYSFSYFSLFSIFCSYMQIWLDLSFLSSVNRGFHKFSKNLKIKAQASTVMHRAPAHLRTTELIPVAGTWAAAPRMVSSSYHSLTHGLRTLFHCNPT